MHKYHLTYPWEVLQENQFTRVDINQKLPIELEDLLNIFTQCRRYSAATIAVAYALIERLIVDITVAPPGMVNADNDLQNPAGSATCSITYKTGRIRYTY